MGYGIRQVASKFHMGANSRIGAVQALRGLARECSQVGYSDSKSILKAPDFPGVMAALRFEVEVLDYSNTSHEYVVHDIVGINFTGESYGAEDEVMEALAPFVSPDSFVEFVGVEGERWRYLFDGQKCTKQTAVVSWVDPDAGGGKE